MPRWLLAVLAVGVAGVIALVVVGRVAASREEENRHSLCLNNLKQIGMALVLYRQTQHAYLPPYLTDDDGRPMHSWRVLLLPYLADEEATALYKQYNFDEPWNSPSNLRLAARMPEIYACPSSDAGSGKTNYLAVVGEETMWRVPKEGRMPARFITDGPADTIMVVESAAAVPWLEPRDLSFDDLRRGIKAPSDKPGVSSGHNGGANVAFADSRVMCLETATPGSALRAMATIAGGEDVDPEEYLLER